MNFEDRMEVCCKAASRSGMNFGRETRIWSHDVPALKAKTERDGEFRRLLAIAE